MLPKIEFKRQSGRFLSKANQDPVKLTALLYLKEALLQEKYEECAGILEIAREFGALPVEIRIVLENPSGVIRFKKALKRVG